jgi:hypothetical protein
VNGNFMTALESPDLRALHPSLRPGMVALIPEGGFVVLVGAEDRPGVYAELDDAMARMMRARVSGAKPVLYVKHGGTLVRSEI